MRVEQTPGKQQMTPSPKKVRFAAECHGLLRQESAATIPTADFKKRVHNG
jgi:hypothetical protein